jgi:hypothetical protein
MYVVSHLKHLCREHSFTTYVHQIQLWKSYFTLGQPTSRWEDNIKMDTGDGQD